MGFGALLKQHRLTRGLSQEALAERAGISVQAISALETGRRHAPYRDTVVLLARALHLAEDERAAMEAAATRPTATAPAPRHNLPVPPTALIGREQEVARAMALLRRPEGRLLTLTGVGGVGGVGKTRLGLAVAAGLLHAYPEGVWLVELAAVAGATSGGVPLVPRTVLAALGPREQPGQDPHETLLAFLRPRRLLLLLDNCEHLIEACAEMVTALLSACPHLRILATSREGLAVAGETLYRVPSLAFPDPDQTPTLAELPRYAAVRLLLHRAQARREDVALTVHNASAVARICARLDGIPLALELAAARLSALTLEQVAARLDQCFRLLTEGSRTALPRQQTLRATLDWSYELLSPPEQILLRRLAVFAGGWTLEAAEAVWSGADVRQCEVLDLLAGLVNKSLVLVEERAGDLRYGLLETVRQYARDRLDASNEAAVRNQHLRWCLALAEGAAPLLRGPEQGLSLGRLDREHDNLRAALIWSSASEGQDAGNALFGLRLADALWRFWYVRGHIREGRGWMERMLSQSGAMPSALRGSALGGAGVLAATQSDYARAALRFEESLAVWRQLGDTCGIADSRRRLGTLACAQGNYGRAAALLEESLLSYRGLGDHRGIASALGNLGTVAQALGNHGRAAALLDESLAIYRELGDTASVAALLRDLGETAWARGDFGRAAKLLEESLALRRELKDRRGIANSLRVLGHWATNQGNYGQAEERFRESLTIGWELGGIVGIAGNLEGLAALVHSRGQTRTAAQLLGAVEALREAVGVQVVGPALAQYDRQTAALRGVLGEEVFAAAWAEGRALPLEEAIALALEET